MKVKLQKVVNEKANMFIVLELKLVKDELPKQQKKMFDKIYYNETMLAEFSKMVMTSYDGDVDKVRNLYPFSILSVERNSLL